MKLVFHSSEKILGNEINQVRTTEEILTSGVLLLLLCLLTKIPCRNVTSTVNEHPQSLPSSCDPHTHSSCLNSDDSFLEVISSFTNSTSFPQLYSFIAPETFFFCDVYIALCPFIYYFSTHLGRDRVSLCSPEQLRTHGSCALDS
jgi:hypothetical protein